MMRNTSGYKYHTFAMELLPNEARFIYDGDVVRRIPDRLIPPGNNRYDLITSLPRAPMNAHVAQFDIPYDKDSLGVDSSLNGWGGNNSITYVERKYFEDHRNCAGCDSVTRGSKTLPAAHHRVDYFKVLDLPAGIKVAAYPN